MEPTRYATTSRRCAPPSTLRELIRPAQVVLTLGGEHDHSANPIPRKRRLMPGAGTPPQEPAPGSALSQRDARRIGSYGTLTALSLSS